ETRQGIGRTFLKEMDKIIARMATHLLADSNSQRHHLIDEQIVAGTKIEVLASGSVCGVDTEKFSPDHLARVDIREKHQIGENDYLFLFVGRLTRDKGVLDLARAFDKVATRYPSAQLLLVGPDEEDIGEQLRQVCVSVGNRLHIASYTATPQKYMAAADVLCLPSYREGFGSVIIEAASAGVPAIASDIYGITDAIQRDITGVLFPPGDISVLAELMGNFLKHPELAKTMGEKARKRAEEEFSCQVMEKMWLSYYDQFSITGKPENGSKHKK
ncbi:MAG: glycosyltransferase family 4 protein, partial [Desulfobacteraceae bacterium]|nr:glycosyltransferase family 4 protein [Desulfobacteraceae bacterium]